MIKRIIFSMILICCLLAIPLALLGFKHVDIAYPMQAFFRDVNAELNGYNIGIPGIPEIPQPGSHAWEIISAVVTFLNFFVKTFNFFITFINVVIKVISFIVIMVKNFYWFVKNMENYSSTSSPYAFTSVIRALALSC